MARKLTSLEKELAVLRGMEFLEALDSNEKNISSALAVAKKHITFGEQPFSWPVDTTLMNGQNLYSLFTALHSVLFKDSYRHEKERELNDANKPGIISPSHKNPQIRGILNRLSAELFTAEGIIDDTENLPNIFARYYKEIAELKAFSYGTTETLLLFLTTLTEAAKDRFLSFDLRRLGAAEERTLTANPLNVESLEQTFSTALNINIRRNKPKTQQPWPKNNDSTIELGGRRFLTAENGRYLVTKTGGLVALDSPIFDGQSLRQKIDAVMDSGTPLDEIRILPKHISSYLNGYSAETTEVDGLDVSKGSPLICMDVNPVTGLTDKYNYRLLALLKKAELTNFFDLSEDANIAKIKKSISTDSEFHKIIDIAAEHIKAANKAINIAVEKAFAGKTPVQSGQNHVVTTIGGGGSGKTSVGISKIQKKAGGDNYVTASLDSARGEFTAYNILTYLGHHGDDYMAVADIAGAVRDRIAERAVKEGYHLLYDGSGLPWNRYSPLAKKWKESCKSVSVQGADCPLYIQEDRQTDFDGDVWKRVEDRLKKEGRGLIIRVTKTKHIEAPASYLEVFADSAVDEFSLYDKSGKFGEEYVIARKYQVTRQQLEQLNGARKEGNLIETLSQNSLLPNQAELPRNLDENNTDFLVHKGKNGQFTILTITNVSGFIDIVRKGTLNKNASGVDTLPYIPDSGRWVTGITKERLGLGTIRVLSKADYSR